MPARALLVLAIGAALLSSPSPSPTDALAGGGEPSGTDPGNDGTDAGLGMLIIGLVGVATLGLLVPALFTALRRRRRPGRPAASQPETTEALLERRALRRSAVELPEDPIVASLGVGEEVRRGTRRRDRPKQAQSGGTER
jgi:hypothetical protein